MSGATASAPARARAPTCLDQDSALSGKPWRRMHSSPPAEPSAVARKRRPLASTMCWLIFLPRLPGKATRPSLPRSPGKVVPSRSDRTGWGHGSLDVLGDEISCGVECPVEDFEQTVALALENHQSRVRNELDLLLKQLETREWVAVAAEKQCRAANLAPVLRAQLVGEAWTVQRIRKKDQAAEVRIDRGHARDPSTKGLTTTDDVMSPTRGLDEDRHCFFRATARKIDRDRIDSSSFETHDVGFHRRRGARCSMTEDDSHDDYRRSLEEVAHRRHHDVIRRNFHNPL